MLWFSRFEKTLLGLFLVSLFGLAASRVHSFDLFWQLQSAKYMLNGGGLIYHDLFTLAAEAPRFEHCWLHDILFYGVWLLGGYAGISLLKGVLVTATAGILVWTARQRGGASLAILLLAPALVLFTRSGWLERPQLWSFLFFALFVFVLEAYRRRPGGWIFALLPLHALWVNLHAASVLAFALVFAYLAGESLELALRRPALPKRALGHLCIVFLLFFATSLLTPYGGKVLETLLIAPSLGGQGGEGPATALFNMDWRRTTFVSDPLFFYAIPLVAAIMAAGWRRLRFTDLFLLAGLALMGWKLSRHVPFFFFGVVAILPLYVDAAVRPLSDRLIRGIRVGIRLVAIAAAVWIGVQAAIPAYRVSGFFDTGLREWHYPVQATAFLREQRLPGNLYNTYDWGGYLAWELFPDYQVFWDGRQNSYEMFKLGWQVMAGEPGWEAVLDRFAVNTIITRACTIDTGEHYPLLDRLRESSGWDLVFADDSALIFLRRTAADPAWLSRHALAKERMADTILATARKMTAHDRWRYLGWWEIARIHWERREYPEAFTALENHLSHSPEGRHEPMAEQYYRILYPLMQQGEGG